MNLNEDVLMNNTIRSFVALLALAAVLALAGCSSVGQHQQVVVEEPRSVDSSLPLASSSWFAPGEFTLLPGGHWVIKYPTGEELFLHNAEVITKQQAREFERSSTFRLPAIGLSVIVTSNGFFVLDFSNEEGDFYVKSHISESKIVGSVESQ